MAQGHFSRARIEAYLGRRFTIDEITISNAGQPDSLNYISYWSDDLAKPQPTEDQLIALKVQGDLIVTNNQRSNSRRNDYPSIANQLDEIYHNGIDSWKSMIKVTKDKYPK